MTVTVASDPALHSLQVSTWQLVVSHAAGTLDGPVAAAGMAKVSRHGTSGSLGMQPALDSGVQRLMGREGA